jgi:hypothetical protein
VRSRRSGAATNYTLEDMGLFASRQRAMKLATLRMDVLADALRRQAGLPV